MRRLLIAVPFVLLVLVACTRTEKTPAADPPGARRDPVLAPDAATAATAKAAPERDLSGWVSDWPKSWTDPRVVAALAEDCKFVPKRPMKEGGLAEMGGDRAADIFQCTLGYEQSCTIDPCIIPSSACESKCTATCGDCGGACATSCTACKGTCNDDTCKKTCATKCGECKQTCTRTMDRCATGDCAKIHAACNGRLRAMWSHGGCVPRCAGHSKCTAACANDGSDAAMLCTERCDDRVSPGFRACNAKCDDLRATANGDGNAPELCLMKCYETVPCAPFLCQGWAGFSP